MILKTSFLLISHMSVLQLDSGKVVPGRNLCAGFLSVGYRELKKIMEDLKVNYSRHTIIQAKDVARPATQKPIGTGPFQP